MKVLHFISRLAGHGSARRLTLLTANLPRPDFEVAIGVAAEPGPIPPALADAGITVEYLDRQRSFDATALGRLRELLSRFRPDVVHVWGMDPLRLLRLAALRLPPVVVSPLLATGPLPGAVDGWLLRRTARVLVQTAAEAERCRQAKVPAARIVQLPPVVDEVTTIPAAPPISGMPAGTRYIAVAGDLVHPDGFRDAVWAFDILRSVYPELHLVVIGNGPAQPRVAQFAADIHCSHCVHFLGDRADAGALLAGAEVVLAPDPTDAGLQTALDAMALGRPVIAPRTPALAEIIVDRATGILVTDNLQSELARQVRLLLDDPAGRTRLGEAGRRRALAQFSVAELVRCAAVLYQELQGERRRERGEPVAP